MRHVVVLVLLTTLCACGDSAVADDEGACAGLEVTVEGTPGDDVLRGTSGPDVIVGRGGDDRLEGLAGDDVLCGGTGADTLVGGEGDDRLDGGADKREVADTEYHEWYGDTLDGGPGNDVLDPVRSRTDEVHARPDTLTFAAAPAGVVVDLAAGTATGDGTDTIIGEPGEVVGSAHDDRLLGSDRGESLIGGRGSDHLDGRGGKDILYGAGKDPGEGERSGNVLVGGPGGDELTGSGGRDELRGGAGADLLSGEGGVDRLFGEDGDDALNDQVVPAPGQVLDGGPGRDWFNGVWLGRDDPATRPTGTIDLRAGRLTTVLEGVDLIVSIPGLENVSTPNGPWTVIGTDGPNEILGGFEQDPVEIHAGAGDDTLSGSFEDDLLVGGPGTDTASPWVGNDRLVSIEKVLR